ncbi:S1 family peptidase [Thermoactinospora rubra]|uniref:S1 family peptidase n=1 Tax=Thermoactinospora rubra TaxID=1088767 RepID=UPI001980AEBB|nr:serine protease [Thermoactinospora rubra]
MAVPAHAAAPPEDVAVGTMLAARTDPAVQLLMMQYGATMEIPSIKPTRAFRALFDKAEKYAKAGRIPADRQSQVKWVLKTAAADADRYLAAAKPYRIVKVKPGGKGPSGVCTGAWVTPQGHLLTAAHCVTETKEALRSTLGQFALPKIVNADVKAFMAEATKLAQPDDGMVKLATKLFGEFDAKHMRLHDVSRQIVALRPDGKGKAAGTRLRVLSKGKAWPGADYALLKAEGVRNLPTVPFGQDGDVRVGETMYINGYPGIVTSSLALDFQSKLRPTLTEGVYSARRTSIFGVPYIQTQASVYGGNSGGPVFDKKGKVVGIVIARLLEDRVGGETETTGLVLPVDVVKKKLAAAGVKPVLSKTSRVYYKALDDFFAHRYRAALHGFGKVLALYPGHPYVREYIAEAKRAIAAGRDRTP